MNQHEIEEKIIALKAKQSEVFKKKKTDRDMNSLEEIRKELNELKAQAKKIYRD